MNELDKYLKSVFDEAKLIFKHLEYDFMSGIWSFDAGSGHTIYCTPFFEDVDGIALSIVNDEGHILCDRDLDYKLTKNPEIDALEFVKVIKIWMAYELGEIEL